LAISDKRFQAPGRGASIKAVQETLETDLHRTGNSLAIRLRKNFKAQVVACSSNSTIEAEDGQFGSSGSDSKRARQVKGIQRTDGLARE
jgi:hypothetical protein